MRTQPHQKLTLSETSDTRTRLTFECVGCLHRIREPLAPSECFRCGMTGGYAETSLGLIVRSRQANDPSLQVPTEYLECPDWSELFTLGVPRKALQLWYGGKGTGKSRLAMRFATSLGRTLVCALEMGEELTTELARVSGSTMSNYWTCGDIGALWHDLPLIEPLCIVIDSIQELRNRKSTIERLYHWAQETGGLVFLISQVNSKNTASGGPASEHKADIVLELRPATEGHARFITRKNRFSLPEGQPIYFLGSGKSTP